MRYNFWVFWLNFFDRIVFYIEDRLLEEQDRKMTGVKFTDFFDVED